MTEEEGEDSPSYYCLRILLLSIIDYLPVNIILANEVEAIRRFGYHPDILATMWRLVSDIDVRVGECTTDFTKNIISKVSNCKTIPCLVTLAKYYEIKRKYNKAEEIYRSLLDKVNNDVTRLILKYKILNYFLGRV